MTLFVGYNLVLQSQKKHLALQVIIADTYF